MKLIQKEKVEPAELINFIASNNKPARSILVMRRHEEQANLESFEHLLKKVGKDIEYLP